jgi:hypothetical protein
MTNTPLPEDIQKFLDASITSLTQLEMLLLLHKHPEQGGARRRPVVYCIFSPRQRERG